MSAPGAHGSISIRQKYAPRTLTFIVFALECGVFRLADTCALVFLPNFGKEMIAQAHCVPGPVVSV
eukprot:1179225-Rhodomonas_salina.1